MKSWIYQSEFARKVDPAIAQSVAYVFFPF